MDLVHCVQAGLAVYFVHVSKQCMQCTVYRLCIECRQCMQCTVFIQRCVYMSCSVYKECIQCRMGMQ